TKLLEYYYIYEYDKLGTEADFWKYFEAALEYPTREATDSQGSDIYSNPILNYDEKQIEELIRNLKLSLDEWIAEIEPSIDEIKDEKVSEYCKIVKEADFIINFNYTGTVEKKYPNTSEKVFHIHGKDKKIIGHKGSEESTSKREVGYTTIDQQRGGNDQELLNMLVNSTEKPVSKCQINLFNKIDSGIVYGLVSTIGFSFSEVDCYYLKKLYDNGNITDTTRWNIGYHLDSEKADFKRVLSKYINVEDGYISFTKY
ncbi:MAG: AbiH family protein, partial [Liquorilactobacillus satsumensis]